MAGASAYPRFIDFAKFREIADACGALLCVDMAHIAGLVAAGLHQSPVPYADFVTTTTHKTLRGPRGGMIICPERWQKEIDKAVFPGQQGGPLMHVIAAKAVSFLEALQPSFKEYQQRILTNAAALAASLTANDMVLSSGGTDNHLMLMDVSAFGQTGKEVEKRLDRARITANKNTIPFETTSPFITSGIRLGTPAVTSRGLEPQDLTLIGELIATLVKEGEDAVEKVKESVKSLCAKYPLYAEDVIEIEG